MFNVQVPIFLYLFIFYELWKLQNAHWNDKRNFGDKQHGQNVELSLQVSVITVEDKIIGGNLYKVESKVRSMFLQHIPEHLLVC